MMDSVRNWILGVVAVGLLVSLCQSLSPEGKTQKVSRFCGGLLLFLAVVTPIVQWDITGTLQAFQDYCESLTVSQEEVAQAGSTVLETQVCQRTQQYLQEQAQQLGAEVTVQVTCKTQEGIPVPDAVTVTGTLTDAQRQQLTQCIQAGFGLTGEQDSTLADGQHALEFR